MSKEKQNRENTRGHAERREREGEHRHVAPI